PHGWQGRARPLYVLGAGRSCPIRAGLWVPARASLGGDDGGDHSGPRMAHLESQNSRTASVTPLEIISCRSGEPMATSSSRLLIEPASSSTAGIRVFLSTTSWS